MRRKKRRKLRKIDMATLLELRSRAMKEANKFGKLFSSPEDAAQEYIVRLLEGRHRHATIQQAMIDIARETVNYRSAHAQTQHNIAHPIYVEQDRLDLFESYTTDTDILFGHLMLPLPKPHKDVVQMYRAGYTLKEIGKKMKLTQSRIHQMYKASVFTMRKAANN